MAKATPAQVKALERAHKQALVNILRAIQFRYIIYKKLGADSEPWKKYATLVTKLSTSWWDRQKKLEKGGANKEGILKNEMYTSDGYKKLTNLARSWDQKGAGIGFIPLIVWAVVAIIGFFTAEEIVDELNTTTEEQATLVSTTQDYCEKYNITAGECQKIMVQNNEVVKGEGGGMFGGIMKFALPLGIGYLVVTNWDKIFKSKKAA